MAFTSTVFNTFMSGSKRRWPSVRIVINEDVHTRGYAKTFRSHVRRHETMAPCDLRGVAQAKSAKNHGLNSVIRKFLKIHVRVAGVHWAVFAYRKMLNRSPSTFEQFLMIFFSPCCVSNVTLMWYLCRGSNGGLYFGGPVRACMGVMVKCG